jgi:hypothetical protein
MASACENATAAKLNVRSVITIVKGIVFRLTRNLFMLSCLLVTKPENNYAATKLVIGIDSRMEVLLGAAAPFLRIAENSFEGRRP